VTGAWSWLPTSI